jgi:NTE family protein
MFARGDSSQDMYGHCRRYFVEQNPTNDYTLPVVSLIRGRKTARLLSDGFGDARIESLNTPFFCTSSDLLRRELFVHNSGPLAEALLASLSIPGVFPPAIGPGGRLLVDGGVFDNLPLRTMASYGVRSLIAVDVTGTSATDGGAAGASASPAWQAALRRWIVGSDAPLPRLPETIIRCMTLASADTVASARQHADLVITPDVTGIGLLDWRQLPQMREAGIAAAGRALAENPDFVTGVSQ